MIEKLAEEPDTFARKCCGPGTRDSSSMRVILLHIADDDSLEPRTQVALDLARAFALSRQGICCEMTEFTFRHGSVAEVMATVAALRGAAYLVMGAYGRPGLVETVLGGVTRALFANPPLPIFTYH